MLLIEDLRSELAAKYKAKKFVNGTVELVGESFLANQPTIFGAPNFDYTDRELDWYRSGSLNVNDIPGGAPKIWQQVATAEGEINSNYGYLFLDERNGSQLENVIRHLIADPGTRRATAVYTRPSIHKDWNWNDMQDFICTNAVQYLIRDGKLDVVVQMRSNDVVFGYRNDYVWHCYAQQLVISDLAANGMHVQAGSIIWNAASLHIYERHFWLLDQFIETGEFNLELTK